MNMYLVGGAVRDRLLGRDPVDFDYVVVGGTEADLRRAVPGLARVGRGIPVFVRGAVQYTLSAFATIEEDLASRDLTINALAEDEHGALVAHPLAVEDVREGILRPVALKNFHADPLRVIRAARFAACFPSFSVHSDLLAAMRAVPADALAMVAGERVGQEVMKACAGPKPGNLLRMLGAGDSLAPWLRELVDAPRLEQLALIMDACAGDRLAVWGGLCQGVAPSSLDPRACHDTRQRVREERVDTVARRLRLSGALVTSGRLAVRWGHVATTYPALAASVRVRLLMDLDRSGGMASFFRMVTALCGVDHGGRAMEECVLLRDVRLPRESRDLGPRSAEILHHLRCAVLDG